MKQEKHGFWLPDKDVHFPDMLMRPKPDFPQGQYQSHLCYMAFQHLKHWRTAIDAGAHVGLITKQLAPKFNKVMGFEPSPENIECFKANITDRNVQLYECALGARNEVRQIRTIPKNSGANFIEEIDTPWEHHLGGEAWPIEVSPLDDFAFEDVDFIKVDVQGYETDLIRGAEGTIRNQKPVILIEQAGWNIGMIKDGNKDALNLLQEWGMIVAEKGSKDLVLVWPDAP